MTLLQNELAEHLRARGDIALTEMALYAAHPAAHPRNYGDGARADVWALTVKWHYRVIIYECKKTRSDFLADVRSGKYKKYLDHCHVLYFAAERGLIKPDEVPEGVGLYTRGPRGGWRIAKRVYRPTKYRISERQALAVMFRLGRGKTTTGAL